MSDARYTIDDLLYLMRRLRDPEFGCPWDLQQTARSIAPSTLEEAFEVVDAIENGTPDELCDELGDLMFQVVFYAQLGAEQQQFDFHEVVQAIVTKLLRRHPHVFPDGQLYGAKSSAEVDESAVKQQWEAIKREERAGRGATGLLANIPLALSALTRAQKMQKRAAGVGFDWDTPQAVLRALRCELDELEEALAAGSRKAVEDELGDVIFSAVNLARHLHLDAEATLRSANQKFTNRFTAVENLMAARGLPLSAQYRAAMEECWLEAKRNEKNVELEKE